MLACELKNFQSALHRRSHSGWVASILTIIWFNVHNAAGILAHRDGIKNLGLWFIRRPVL